LNFKIFKETISDPENTSRTPSMPLTFLANFLYCRQSLLVGYRRIMQEEGKNNYMPKGLLELVRNCMKDSKNIMK
jgi:hypothetical protein